MGPDGGMAAGHGNPNFPAFLPGKLFLNVTTVHP